MQASLGARGVSCARSSPQQQRRPLLAAAPAPAAAAPRQGAAVVCHAKVELQDLSGAMHVLDVPADATLLDAAIDANVDVPYDCKMGVCLRCSAKLQSGSVEQPGAMIDEDNQAAGFVLMCVAYPQSDCKVKVIPEEELMDAVMA